MEKIETRRFLGILTTTLLIHRSKPGYEIELGPVTYGSVKYKMIPLSDFKGWKEGHILKEMKENKPDLIVETPDKKNHMAVIE